MAEAFQLKRNEGAPVPAARLVIPPKTEPTLGLTTNCASGGFSFRCTHGTMARKLRQAENVLIRFVDNHTQGFSEERKMQMSLAFVEALHNANDHGRNGSEEEKAKGVLVEVSYSYAEIKTAKGSRTPLLVVSVGDRGKGIPLDKINEMVKRVETGEALDIMNVRGRGSPFS